MTSCRPPGSYCLLSLLPPTPTPPPPTPPTPPLNVTARAGDAQAVIAWSAPASSGSFAISNYQVTIQPGGAACVTSQLTCTATGLHNGTTYTATVQALSAAGWGAPSSPSAEFIPEAQSPPIIVITGGRGSQGRSARVTVDGNTSLPAQSMVTPWLSVGGQKFQRGITDALVDADSRFTWSRIINSGVRLYFTGPGNARSNVLVIPPRPR